MCVYVCTCVAGAENFMITSQSSSSTFFTSVAVCVRACAGQTFAQDATPPTNSILCIHPLQQVASCLPRHTLSRSSCLDPHSSYPPPPYLCISTPSLSSTFVPHGRTIPTCHASPTPTVIPKRCNNSWLDFRSCRLTPHIHRTIIFSVLSSPTCLRLSWPTFHYHIPSPSGHTFCRFYLSASRMHLFK